MGERATVETLKIAGAKGHSPRQLHYPLVRLPRQSAHSSSVSRSITPRLARNTPINQGCPDCQWRDLKMRCRIIDVVVSG